MRRGGKDGKVRLNEKGTTLFLSSTAPKLAKSKDNIRFSQMI